MGLIIINLIIYIKRMFLNTGGTRSLYFIPWVVGQIAWVWKPRQTDSEWPDRTRKRQTDWEWPDRTRNSQIMDQIGLIGLASVVLVRILSTRKCLKKMVPCSTGSTEEVHKKNKYNTVQKNSIYYNTKQYNKKKCKTILKLYIYFFLKVHSCKKKYLYSGHSDHIGFLKYK